MAARTSWEGYLRLNLLSVPVKAYSAIVTGGGKIGFHMIHSKCNSRIRYKKVCPIHGEVPNDEIVPGYQYAKGKYIIVDREKLAELLPENEKAIDIDTFIHPDDLDPVYFEGRSYYLVPDGRVAEKPFAVLQKVMADEKRYAVAKMIFAGRENIVVVRPLDGLLIMMMMHFDEQIKKPATFRDEAPEVEIAGEELKLARTLVEASTSDKFDVAKYHDEYTEKVAKLLEAKAAGKKIAPVPGQEEPVVINLMDALRQSLDRAKRGAPARNGARSEKPKAKKKAASHKSRREVHRRKTG